MTRGATLRRHPCLLIRNGRFYTHWVPEDPEFRPDLGVDMSSQVSLANAYASHYNLGRSRNALAKHLFGLNRAQCVKGV